MIWFLIISVVPHRPKTRNIAGMLLFNKIYFELNCYTFMILSSLPENIRVTEFVHQLDLLEHVRSVGRKLVHFQDHHLTSYFVGDLENKEIYGSWENANSLPTLLLNALVVCNCTSAQSTNGYSRSINC